MDHGSLRYFRDVLHRVTVGKDIKKDVNACIDLLLTIVKGHWVSYACKELQIEDPTGNPTVDVLPKEMKSSSEAVKRAYLDKLGEKVVSNFTVLTASFTGEEIVDSKDGVYNYSRVLCHYGSLIMEFLDGWSEADGDRVYRYVHTVWVLQVY